VYSSAAIGADGTRYVGSTDNNVYALTSTGELAWSYTTGERVDQSPSIGSDGCIYVGSGDNRLYVFEGPPTPTPTSTPTATTAPAATSTPTAVPGLSIEPGQLQAGKNFTFTINLTQSINEAFDFYVLADTQFGPYTLYLDGRVKKGIKAIYKNVRGYRAQFLKEVRCRAVLPKAMGGKEVTFYAAVVKAGKIPPVSRLSQLSSNTPYVILLGKSKATVAP